MRLSCSSAASMRPPAETVRQMITDAIEAEKNGLWGRAYVDGARNAGLGLELGDRWMAEIWRSCALSACRSFTITSRRFFPTVIR